MDCKGLNVRVMLCYILFLVAILVHSSLAVNVAGGERVGGCPEDVGESLNNSTEDECMVDSDCEVHAAAKCCKNGDGVHLCIMPIPACKDGYRVSLDSILQETCSKAASRHCIDQGCEDGPEGGWVAACCPGYAYQWTGAPRPTCNGSNIMKDSEEEDYLCGSDYVRGCPPNAECVESEGHEICCPKDIVPKDSAATSNSISYSLTLILILSVYMKYCYV